MQVIYVDTGVWVALLDAEDQHHARAKQIVEENQPCGFVSSELVLAEAVTILRRCVGPQVAADFAREFLDHETGEMTRTDDKDWRTGLDVMEQFKEQKLSLADVTSFAVIRRLDIKRVAAFDKHFRIVLKEREILGA